MIGRKQASRGGGSTSWHGGAPSRAVARDVASSHGATTQPSRGHHVHNACPALQLAVQQGGIHTHYRVLDTAHQSPYNPTTLNPVYHQPLDSVGRCM